MKKKNVLILCPSLIEKGGVAYYYLLVKKYFASERISLSFYHTGKEYVIDKNQNRISKSLFDLLSLIKTFPHYDLIVLNPSLDAKAIIRDGIFHFLAKRFFHRKTLVFFHGWVHEFEQLIDRYGRLFFRFIFNYDKAVVLSRKFKNTLILWGYDSEDIKLETTTYEDYKIKTYKDPFKLVFLSRLTKNKGCLEAIQIIEILAKDFPNMRLFIVGEGEMAPELQSYVVNRNLNKTVEFTGWLEGEKKYYLLSQCGIMLYPTTYGEGMPISLLEGMGMGLAVVTRPVGGIPDIFIDGENGFLIDSLDPNDFAMKIKFLFRNRDVWQAISDRNRKEARDRFEINNVVKRLEQLYLEMVTNDVRFK